MLFGLSGMKGEVKKNPAGIDNGLAAALRSSQQSPPRLPLGDAHQGGTPKFFRIMSSEDQRNVASYYNQVRPPLLITWVHTAVYLRNICGHYGRLYNRHLKVNNGEGYFPPIAFLLAFL